MSVVQGIVCRPSTSGDVIVLANCELEVAQPSSNSSTAIPSEYLAAKIIEKRAQLHFNNDGKIEIDGYFIHYAVSLDGPGPLIYACVAEPEVPSDRAQQFLLNVKTAVLEQNDLLGSLRTLGDHALQQQIHPILQHLMMAENNTQRPPHDTRIEDMRRQVDEVKNVMAANVASLMERGERLDSIERRTDELQASAGNFKMTAHRVQRRMFLTSAKWTIICVLFGIAMICIIILLILNAFGVFKKK
ncbi:unnamed protein product [Cylicocyclus nassatus]|uniref:Vesicle-associated membrane protein 7 n=1 Tax=Cylicocyclus nassatus TaxID=53992 RepID=A0AA36H5Y3_CYLNA|nr:unnamed protein product [Cylicocyclus nassatus]